MKSSFLPKYKQKIVKISALTTHRAEILTIFRSYFGKNDDFISSFQNFLAFNGFVVNTFNELLYCTPSFGNPHLTSSMASKYGGCDLRGFDYALQNGPRRFGCNVNVLQSSSGMKNVHISMDHPVISHLYFRVWEARPQQVQSLLQPHQHPRL